MGRQLRRTNIDMTIRERMQRRVRSTVLYCGVIGVGGAAGLCELSIELDDRPLGRLGTGIVCDHHGRDVAHSLPGMQHRIGCQDTQHYEGKGNPR